MALTKVINDLADLNQSGSTNALKGCAGTTAQQPASSSSIDYLIVGGGGGGGGFGQAGGGGAGGYKTGSTTVYHGTPTVITVGEGGSGGYSTVADYTSFGVNGDDSGFNGFRGIGGGCGAGAGGFAGTAGSGGSGGGAGTQTGSITGVSLDSQGNDGGAVGTYSDPYWGSGGGGAGNPFLNSNGTGGSGGSTGSGGTGTGGSGVNINTFINSTDAAAAGIGEISGSDVYVAGGGAAGSWNSATGASGGVGGGADSPAGAGGSYAKIDGTNGTVNTGGGGSGASAYSSGAVGYSTGGSGGSGVGILKYDNTIVTGYTLNSEDTYTVNWPASTFGIAYWPLNLNVKDVGGHYDGTSTDVTYVTGNIDQAASFNGSSSKINLGNQTFFNSGDWSISFWMKNQGNDSNFQYLVTQRDTSEGDSPINISFYGVSYSSNPGKLNFNVSNSYFTSTSALTKDTWYHVVFTIVAGGAMGIYINGVLDASGTETTTRATPTTLNLAIGSNGSNTDYPFNGLIEQVRVYKSALSLASIQDIYNNSKPGSLPPLKTSSDLTTAETSFPSGATTFALWDFNGDSVADPTTYNGTDSSISYVSGKFGECAQFNGTSSAITFSSNPINWGTSNYSVSFWFNATSVPGTYMTFIGTYSAVPGGWSIDTGTTTDYLRFYFDGGGGVNLSSTSTFTTGVWYHVAITMDHSSAAKIYLNGIEDAVHSGSSIGTNTGATMIIGYNAQMSSNTLNGSMDQLRIFNSALTAEQIYDLWQKENDIQTYFPNSSTDTDTLVFKSGSGEITFKNDTPPGGEIGMLRYNSTLSGMEHFNAGGWKKFLSPLTIETLIVGGGGGTTNLAGSGGGGAGGVLSGSLSGDLKINTDYSIQVGAGGTGSTYTTMYYGGYSNGSNSFISSWIANGGGYSAGACCAGWAVSWPNANAGGSGGGGGGYPAGGQGSAAGTSNQTSISPLTGYGNAGGINSWAVAGYYMGAGGGGAGAVGETLNAATTYGGAGGVGIISTIIDTTMASTYSVGEVSGSDVYFAGGGGGWSEYWQQRANGGLGGGGNNSTPTGTAATGGGGGGGTGYLVSSGTYLSYAGGSGVVILKYPSEYICTLSGATGLTEIVDTSVSGFKISIFKVSSEGTNGTGTIKFTA